MAHDGVGVELLPHHGDRSDRINEPPYVSQSLSHDFADEAGLQQQPLLQHASLPGDRDASSKGHSHEFCDHLHHRLTAAAHASRDSKAGDRGTGLIAIPANEWKHLLQVLASSIIGNALEWYDFLVFVYLAPVISHLFFPSDNQFVRLIQFYGVFAASFVSRPAGAAVFGWLGDKYGRKLALTWSIYLMAVPTTLVGCLPTFQQVGVAAPVLLVIIRVLQGLAVGGEFTSTLVFLVEHAPPQHQGVVGSAAFLSVTLGVLAGSGVATLFLVTVPEDQMFVWGWRVPFLLSIVGAAVGAYIRQRLTEPPSSRTHHGDSKLSSVAWAVATVIMLDFLTALGFYLSVIYLPTFFHEFIGLSKVTALVIHTLNMVLYMLVIPVGGWLSDRHGRCVLMGTCAVLGAVLGWPLWLLLSTGNPFLAWLSQAVMTSLLAAFCGPLPAAMVALFPGPQRCLGISVGHNLSMAIFGGTAPMMATALLRANPDNLASPGVLFVAGSALSAVGVLMARRLFALH